MYIQIEDLRLTNYIILMATKPIRVINDSNVAFDEQICSAVKVLHDDLMVVNHETLSDRQARFSGCRLQLNHHVRATTT